MSQSSQTGQTRTLNDYIEMQLEKRQLKTIIGVGQLTLTIWQLRSLLVASVAHFFDTATDIALMMEWYYLYTLQEEYNKDPDSVEIPSYLDPENIDMRALFGCSLTVLIYYRISSGYTVYDLTHSKIDCIFQFLLDFYLIKAIYVNIYKMKSHKALSFVRIIRGFEGQTESAFQAILAMVCVFMFNFICLF